MLFNLCCIVLLKNNSEWCTCKCAPQVHIMCTEFCPTVYADNMTMELSFVCFLMDCLSEFLQNVVFLSLERDCFYLKVSKQCRP